MLGVSTLVAVLQVPDRCRWLTSQQTVSYFLDGNRHARQRGNDVRPPVLQVQMAGAARLGHGCWHALWLRSIGAAVPVVITVDPGTAEVMEALRREKVSGCE